MTLSYKQHPVDSRWDATVIGSGMGGLTAAALLAKHAGKRVLVLERHGKAGGYTHTFRRPGYEWDTGLHYIGQVHDPSFAVRCAFDHLTEGRLEWNRMPDVYDRVIIAGQPYDFPSGRERFREQMKRYFPGEGAAIDRYLKATKAASRASVLFFAEKAVPRAVAAVAGPVMRYPFLRWAGRTTADVLAGITGNRELAGVLTAQWGNYGLPPRQSSFGAHAVIAEHYFEGAGYPVGGAGRIAESILPVIEAYGGRLMVSAEVAEILVERGRATGVRMADGREIRARIVISGAGAHNTFGKLLPKHSAATAHAGGDVRLIPPSSAFLGLYVGLWRTARELGLDGTNLWIHPTADHDENLRRCQYDAAAPFPFLFISFPSAKDPDFESRHPGRATIELVTIVPFGWFEPWRGTRWRRRGEDYDAFKAKLSARLLTELERHVPAAAGKVDFAELSTPLSTQHFMNYERGEAYGLATTPERFQLRSLGPRTPIRDLYLTGQDVASPGVTGALFGGVLTASAVLGRNLMPALLKPAAAGFRGKPGRVSYGLN